MPRRPRLAVGGIPWHIIQRGNNRSACFYCEEDYLFYLDNLFEQASIENCVVHAYVLMTNHTHILLTPQEAEGPSRLMKQLGQRYVQYINRTYRRTGTLWEGRFKSSLVGSSDYILACYRYIELNPVRAGMVAHPAEYQWSSYGHNGLGELDDRLSYHDEYIALGRDPETRKLSYQGLFNAEMQTGLVDQIRLSTNGNYALGNQQFKNDIEKHLMKRVSPGKAGRPRKTS